MRHVKITIILGIIFIGSVIGTQAKSGVVPTYEQTAEDMYDEFSESITQNLSDFRQTPRNIKKGDAFRQIEADIAVKFGTSSEQVRKMITDYKQDYVAAMETETNRLKSNMLGEYAKNKKGMIQKEITEDITTFLNDLLTE